MTARKKVIQGGTSAGKTYAIIPILIDRCAKEPKLKVTVVAETIPAVKDGAVDIFKTIMQGTGRWVDSRWLGNPMQYTFANGSRIQFKAFDTVGKAKASGKRDILFINEGNHIPYPIADALMIRSKEVYIDYNPDEEFWAHTEVLTEPNSDFLQLTYKDNEALPPETLEDLLIKRNKGFFNSDLQVPELLQESNIKNKYWANWWKVYGLGMVGTLEGVIFQNWSIVESIPQGAKLVGYGMDFGYTNDPSTLIAVYKFNNKLITDELIYEKGMTNDRIAKRMKDLLGISKNDFVFADSSEPKSIAEINAYGFNVKAVTKGKDSINFGIGILQEYEIEVTARSINLIKELRKYAWDKDKEGNRLNRPIDEFNHAIDGLRYLAMMKLSKNQPKQHIFKTEKTVQELGLF